MSSSDTYSYNKSKLFKAPILGIIIFIFGFFVSISIPNMLTLEHFINQAKHYKSNIKKFTCMSSKQRKEIGFTQLKNTIKNLNYCFNFGLAKEKNICDELSFLPLPVSKYINLIKIYMVLIGSSSTFLLLKYISNLTINSIISNTIYSDIKTTPFNKPNNKKKVNKVGNTIYTIFFYIFNIFIISIPIIFIYSAFGFDFFNVSGSENIISKIIACIIIGLMLIVPLIYILCNSFYSIDAFCKNLLKDFFITEDKQYVDNIYNSLLINSGIFIAVFIILIIIHINMVYMIKPNYNKILYLFNIYYFTSFYFTYCI